MPRIVTHTGEFMSKAGTLYRVDIWRKGDEQPTNSQPEELRFEAVEPLVIDWGETSKETPICGSTATLSIESPGDRTYINLYTVKPGEIGLDVYREGALYWRGTLDPESYEEPYERAELYPVSLAFSDFGMLDRVKFSPSQAFVSLQKILEQSLRSIGLGDLPTDARYISLTTSDDSDIYDALCVRAANFVDEEGKAMTMREAMEAMLQPCGLKLMQRSGRLWLYDLQGLYAKAPTRWTEWSSDKQRLAVDKVANAVTLNFSPYALNKILDATDVRFTKRIAMSNAITARNGEGDTWVVYTDKEAARRARTDATSYDARRRDAEFLFALDGRKFRIIPLKGGTDAVGVRNPIGRPEGEEFGGMSKNVEWAWRTYEGRSSRVYLPPLQSAAATQEDAEAVERALRKAWEELNATGVMSPLALDVKPKVWPRLRIKMECLMDVRYNPFAEAPKPDTTDANDAEIYNKMKAVAAWCFTPVRVALYDRPDGFAPVMTYSNESAAHFETDNPLVHPLREDETTVADGWKSGDEGVLWLAYYPDPENIREDSALMKGWATNRPCIGRPDYSTPLLSDGERRTDDYDSEQGRAKYRWLQRLSGEFIDYPPEGGWLEISYGGGMLIHDYKGWGKHGEAMKQGHDEFKDMRYLRQMGLEDKLQWLLYKAPEVEVVRDWGDFGAVTVDDVETRTTLHPDAREELKFNLKCGTLPNNDTEGEAVARGVYVDKKGRPLRQLKRAGQTDAPERLFINSLYSQYATRCEKISGEAYIDPEGLASYKEHAQSPAAQFIATATRQDLMEDCGDVTLVRLINEHYRPTFDA